MPNDQQRGNVFEHHYHNLSHRANHLTIREGRMKIRVGTNVQNVTVEIDKPFAEIEYADICQALRDQYGIIKFRVYGWCPLDDIISNLKSSLQD